MPLPRSRRVALPALLLLALTATPATAASTDPGAALPTAVSSTAQPPATSEAAAASPASFTKAKFKKKVIGNGTPRSCTYAKLAKAVRSGGDISFDCGPDPVTIVVQDTLVTCNTHSCKDAWNGGKVVTRVRIDGGGKVTLSGGGKRGIFYANTCDRRLGWIDAHCNTQTTPHVTFRNITMTRGNATTGPAGYEGVTGGGGGGAIAMRGGQLTVRNATFTKNRCMKRHSDAGGGAIRVTGQSNRARVIRSTFRGNRCANGGAVSALLAPVLVKKSTFVKNRATGHGASSGLGGNGGAIYFDGRNQNVKVAGSTIRRNRAPEGGPGIFYVSNDRTGRLTVKNSRIVKNPGASFWTGRTKSIFFLGKKFTRTGSTIR